MRSRKNRSERIYTKMLFRTLYNNRGITTQIHSITLLSFTALQTRKRRGRGVGEGESGETTSVATLFNKNCNQERNKSPVLLSNLLRNFPSLGGRNVQSGRMKLFILANAQWTAFGGLIGLGIFVIVDVNNMFPVKAKVSELLAKTGFFEKKKKHHSYKTLEVKGSGSNLIELSKLINRT